MRMGARFRRAVGIFGAMSIVLGTAVGAALTVGQTAASAASGAWSLDLATPNALAQNVLGSAGTPPYNEPGIDTSNNAGDGWSFQLNGWTAGDQITLTIGTGNGPTSPQLVTGPATPTPGVPLGSTPGTNNAPAGTECNTTDTNGFGVNQTTDDMGNFVLFNAGDAIDTAIGGSSTIIEATSGEGTPPVIATNLGGVAKSPSGQTCGVNGDSNQLILTFLNTEISPFDTAEVYLGYSNITGSPAASVSAPLTYDTGFGAATGPVTASAVYVNAVSLGVAAPAGSPGTAITVPSDATVFGQTPSGNSPSLGIQRTTGSEVVASQPISNFQITDLVGDSVPPNDHFPALTLASVPANYGPFGAQTTGGTLTPGGTYLDDAPGIVCLQLDNSTSQNLQFTETSTTFTVTGGANTTGLSATTGPGTVQTYPAVGNTILGLPVSTPSGIGQAASWVASNLSLGTAPATTNLSEGKSTGVTESDGPVWAYVYWVSDPGSPLAPTATASCYSGNTTPAIGLNSLNDDSPGQPTDVTQLGYVQLSTVSELANSIYGASQVSTAAQAIGHQFNYATGSCVGPGANESDNHAGGVLFVATDADYHDALGAAYPAGADSSAVALTDPGSLSTATGSIIREEGVQTVYLVGGDLAISNNVENQLASTTSYLCGGVEPRINALGQTENLTVIRIAGQTADDTNLQLADFPGAQPITPTPGPFGAYKAPTAFNDTGAGTGTAAPTATTQNTAILVTDASFPDAVSGSALAYGWPMPLIVTTPGALDLDALEAIFNDHINQVIVLGGILAVTPAVISELPAGVTAVRVAGIDGSDTSTQLAAFELSTALGIGVDNNDPQWGAFVDRTAGEIAPPPGFSAQGDTHAHAVLLARGDYYADAETASVLAVHNGLFGFNTTLKPLVLAESPTSLGSYVTSFLSNAGLAISGLPGEVAAGGWSGPRNPLEAASGADGLETPSFGNQVIEGPNFGKPAGFSSSSVYTVQPIGGPLALGQGVLNAAIAAVTAG